MSLPNTKRNSWGYEVLQGFFIPILLLGLKDVVIIKERSRKNGVAWSQVSWQSPTSLPLEQAKEFLRETIEEKGAYIAVMYNSAEFPIRIGVKYKEIEFSYRIAIKKPIAALYCICIATLNPDTFKDFKELLWSDAQLEEIKGYCEQLEGFDLSTLPIEQYNFYQSALREMYLLVKENS